MGEEPSGFLENILLDGTFSRVGNESECYDDLFSGFVLNTHNDFDGDTDVSTRSRGSPNDDVSSKKKINKYRYFCHFLYVVLCRISACLIVTVLYCIIDDQLKNY